MALGVAARASVFVQIVSDLGKDVRGEGVEGAVDNGVLGGRSDRVLTNVCCC